MSTLIRQVLRRQPRQSESIAVDAMDWHPQTPPPQIPQHDPYSNPFYVPGGWPTSTPFTQQTTGIFAVKRKASCISRAAKRVCSGVSTVGEYALLPAKSVTNIVREWKQRRRENKRRDQINRAKIDTTAQWARASAAIDLDSRKYATLLEKREEILGLRHTKRKTPTSWTHDTEESAISAATHSVKRQRFGNSRVHRTVDPIIKQEAALARKRAGLPTPEPEMPLQADKLRGNNPFNAGYKRSPVAYGARGAVAKLKVQPIGSKIEAAGKEDSLFGGYAYEKPIEITPPPSPRLAERPKEKNEIPIDTNTRSPDHESSTRTKQEDNHQIFDNAPKVPHDERWNSLPCKYPWKGENYYTYVPPDPSAGVKQEELPQMPGFKKRPIFSIIKSQVEGSVRAKHESKAIGANESKVTDLNTSNTSTDTLNGVLQDEEVSNIRTLSDSVDSAAAPVTPMKVIDQKPAQQNFETPEAKLSKLHIKDDGDDDTPKATPHSGTKTTRVTRYREALEKAAKAKLEQYELVAITSEWDQKVRAAVRNGIPDYLGPHDLARVVPQYASRGQDNWLNDETINKYLEIVAEHGRKNDRPDQIRSHHSFNNFFYNNLKSKGPESVLRWAKRAKIGGKNLAYVEKIFVPVNSGAHWTLAVVEPVEKRISHYNSMRGAGTGRQACSDLLGWVQLELGKDFKEEEWTLTAVAESPQQTNSDDCGVFTITSARQIMLGYTPMSYGHGQIPIQRIRIVAELINRGLLRSSGE